MDVPLTLLLAPAEPGAGASLAALGRRLARRLGHAVVPVQADAADAWPAGVPPALAGGVRRVVTLPLVLDPAGTAHRAVVAAVTELRRRWPELHVHAGSPPATDDVARMLGDRAREVLRRTAPAPLRPDEVVVVLVGAGDANPTANAELARVARLVGEADRFAEVGYAFLALTAPSVGQIVARWARLGARAVVVVPYALLGGRLQRRLVAAAADAARASGIAAPVARPLASHPALLWALVRRHLDALGPAAGEPGGAWVAPGLLEVLRGAHGHGTAPLADLAARIAALLPRRYQDGGASVSPAPMGAAPLAFDGDGAVAWDRMWQGFCELALAGGPPHRDTLLEPAPRERVLAEPARYAAVVRELERGLRMVTGLEVVTGGTPGWIGLVCASEAMAIWLLRAIVVENVLARREGAVLFLPAAPEFTLGGEIKNVVTAVAKTYHYWLEHARQ
ncbi:MAG TPA: CbiX/SirB N-terminal domain-containing protein [Methylomirabilota bacterium]|nr:CbiX/SirB N-terminal domain-containing protein [Methylomirabilota bacterium]